MNGTGDGEKAAWTSTADRIPVSPARRAARASRSPSATLLLMAPNTVEDVDAGLRAVGYLPGESTSLVSFLAARLGKPVLVEGPAGVGKTELAKALASYLGRTLI